MGLIRINSDQHWWAYNNWNWSRMADNLIGPRRYSCYKCRNLVSCHEDIVSKGFQVSHQILVSTGSIRLYNMKLYIIFSLNLIIIFIFVVELNLIMSCRQSSGRAFLFSHAANIVEGPKEDRHLLYRSAHSWRCLLRWLWGIVGLDIQTSFRGISQKYKEGKIVLEKFKIAKDNW